VVLHQGDGVVLYTDGITEAENAAREQHGLEWLGTVVSQYWAQPAEVIKEAVVADVQRHIGATRCIMINTLSKFVLLVRQPKTSQMVIQGNRQFAWQQKSLPHFPRLLPGLLLEIV
jgi:hypothetical protein